MNLRKHDSAADNPEVCESGAAPGGRLDDDAVTLLHLSFLRMRELSEGTVYQRRRHLIRLRLALGKQLLEVTEADLDAWQTQVLGHLSPGARATSIAHIAEFYKWAVRQRLVDVDPSVQLIRPRVPNGVPRPISEEDLQVALNTADERIHMWLCLAAWAGLRAMEIAGLHRSDVMDTAATPVLIVRGKGGKTRIVPIGERLLLALRAAGLPARGYVFLRRDGAAGPNKPWNVSRLANVHLHDLGIDATLHALRHRYGTMLYAITQNIRLVQELMGHSSPATTARYVAFSQTSAVQAMAELDKTLVPPSIGRQALLPFADSTPPVKVTPMWQWPNG